MKRAIALALLLTLPLLGTACTPPAPKPTPKPVTLSAAPVAGEVRAYGWTRPATPPPAETRFKFKRPLSLSSALPKSVDLRGKDVPVYNQSSLGSCTANGWAGAVEYRDKNAIIKPPAVSAFDRFLIYIHIKTQPPVPTAAYFQPSRLFIYYNERALEGTIGQDVGAAVADGAKIVSTLGTPPESDWNYVISKFARKPPAKAYADAKLHVAPEPSSVDTTDLDEVRTALAEGHPVVFGFDVYGSFESVGDDGVYLPAGRSVGGHCVVVVGYDDANKYMIVRNSWGTQWGADGYFYFPYKYFASAMTSDAWTIAD